MARNYCKELSEGVFTPKQLLAHVRARKNHRATHALWLCNALAGNTPAYIQLYKGETLIEKGHNALQCVTGRIAPIPYTEEELLHLAHSLIEELPQ